MKIEEGDTFTSYIQPLSDLNLDTTKIYDSSGYGNDGILTGILETSNDTSKYQLSSFFNGFTTDEKELSCFLKTAFPFSISSKISTICSAPSKDNLSDNSP